MTLSVLQTVLLSLFIAFMATEAWWWGGTIYIARPIFAAPIVGLILGDFQTGLYCGGVLEMLFLGGLSMGAYTPPNSYIGGMVGTAIAIMNNGNVELGVAIAYPIAVLVQWLNYGVTNINLIWVEKAEAAIRRGDDKKYGAWHFMCILTIMLVRFFLPTVIALLLGDTVISNFYASMPAFIKDGLKVAAGILPAIGIASIVSTLGIKKGWPFFLLGFVLSAYLGMDIMSIALLGIALAFILFQASNNGKSVSIKLDKDSARQGCLDNKDMRRMFFRSFQNQGAQNYKTYCAPGHLYAIIPGLKKIYKDNPEALQEAYNRNLEFYNTHPYFDNLIMGVQLAMEEENANSEDFDTSMISATKTALMGPLAGVGDSVFQGTFRVLFSAIGAGLAMNGNVAGPIIYLLANVALAWGTRWYFLKGGYSYGTQLVKRLRTSNLFEKFVDGATVVGMMVIAAMTSGFVYLTLKAQWVYVAATEEAAAKAITLQSIFDAIMPNFLPLLLVIGMYQVMKKVKGGIYWCLFGTFVISILGVWIGLF